MPRNEANTQAYARAQKSGRPSIEKVTVKMIVDESPDLSCIGEYTDDYSEWNIEIESGEYCHDLPEDHEHPSRGREYRYFTPYAGGEKPGSKHYREHGLQDFRRMESLNNGDWCMIGIVADATILVPAKDHAHIQRVSGGSLWGIESDSGDDYMQEIARECLSELWAQLAALNVPEAEIERAKAEIGDEIDIERD